MFDNKETIKKHSAIIQTNVKELTLTQRKLINYLILVAQKTGRKEIYKTSVANIKEICGIGKTENVDLKEQLKKLSDIRIEFNYINKDKNEVWQVMSLLSSVEVIRNTGIVEFEFSVKLLDKVLNPSMYTPLSVSLVSKFKSSYSIILYEFLRDYVSSPKLPVLTVNQVRTLLGIKEEEYERFLDFRKRVLSPAIKEINNKTDIYCEYELIKQAGNKYSHIQWHVSKKKTLPEQLRPITQLELSFNGGESSHTEDVKVSPVTPPEPPRAEEKARQLDPVHVEISERLKMKPELVSSLVDKHGLDKVKRVMEFTLAEPRKSVSGFFIKALEEGYFIPGPELQAVKSGDDALQKERISALRYEAHKCFSTQGGPGDCGIHDRTNPGSPCCYCKKWNRSGQTANVLFAQI